MNPSSFCKPCASPNSLDSRSVLSSVVLPSRNGRGNNGGAWARETSFSDAPAAHVGIFQNPLVHLGWGHSENGPDKEFGFLPSQTSLEPAPLPDGPDEILAKGMSQLSVKERDVALHDVHGVADAPIETPELIESGLSEMAAALDNIPFAEPCRRAYNLAAQQSQSFVTDEKFRLLFLRAEEFDAAKAVDRLLRFFQEKMTYFGISKLTKPITLDDMDEGDIECIKSGLWQVLPQTDRAGRSILMTLPKMRGNRTNQNKMRAYFYVCMSAIYNTSKTKDGFDCSDSENHSTLRKSNPERHQFVHIFYHMGKPQLDKNHIRCLAKLRSSLPMIIKCDHLVFNNPIIKPFFTTGMMAIDVLGRVRIRFHCGTDMEVQYNLMGFGFPVGALPVSTNGDMLLDNHITWFHKRQKVESIRPPEHPKASKRQTTSDTVGTIPEDDWSLCDDESVDDGGLVPLLPDMEFRGNESGSCDNLQAPLFAFSAQAKSSGLLDQESIENQTDRPDIHTSIGALYEMNQPLASKNCSSDVPVIPTDDDVMFGRGKPIQNRKGNIRFRKILDEFRSAYDTAEKYEKSEIAKEIVRRIRDVSGRFIKQEKNGEWYEVDEAAARVKIGHAFRTRRRAVNRARNEAS